MNTFDPSALSDLPPNSGILTHSFVVKITCILLNPVDELLLQLLTINL